MDAIILILKNKGKDISTQVLHELLVSTLNFLLSSSFIKTP